MERIAELFALGTSLAEIFVRGTAMYWFLFLLFRFVVRRDMGGVGLADLLVVVLVADAAQNAMAGDYYTITDGMLLVATLIGWNLAIDWAAFHFSAVERFVQPPPLALIRNGRILHRNLRQEYVTVDDLKAKLRERGVDDVAQVRKAFLESDGQVTVIRMDGS